MGSSEGCFDVFCSGFLDGFLFFFKSVLVCFSVFWYFLKKGFLGFANFCVDFCSFWALLKHLFGDDYILFDILFAY